LTVFSKITCTSRVLAVLFFGSQAQFFSQTKNTNIRNVIVVFKDDCATMIECRLNPGALGTTVVAVAT
jgi:hypothetical protein